MIFWFVVAVVTIAVVSRMGAQMDGDGLDWAIFVLGAIFVGLIVVVVL